MSALLTERQGKRDDTIKYLNDCRHNGLTILPPCVNESGLEYTPVTESKSIRFGLGAIKELGDVAVRVIQKESVITSYSIHYTKLYDLATGSIVLWRLMIKK